METHSTSTNTLARSSHVSESVARSYGVLGHANDDQTPSSSTTTPPTTPPTRNTGYGGFCFGRQDMYTLSKKVITDPYGRKTRICYTEEEGLRSGSKNVLHQEIDGFERRGYFPFFKLPLDIRRKIYRELVQPFFELDPDSNQYVLNLALMEQRTLYNAIDFQYGLEAVVDRNSSHWQFRHELGSIVWANTRLIMGATDTGLVETGDRLLAFLEERPAAHQGIKSLSINLDDLESWCDGYGDPISNGVR
ncbi:hypothetical protein BKA61DRAFT_715697 [Leptodontidium sp. MPI-SDFR-AT-0119]|nr:hypothetical protein BKA61DRAFT_715697 [Leptodontidium sp. MPI-SDFR-AT-0119]